MRKRIGIACGCRKLNYGSILQSFALCKVVKFWGYDCNFVWVRGNLFKHYNIRMQKIIGTICNVIKHPSLLSKLLKSCYDVFFLRGTFQVSENTVKKFDEFKKMYLDIRMYSYNELKREQKKYKCFICGSDQIWNTYEYYMDPMYFLQFTDRKKRIAYAPSFGTNSISFYNKKTVIRYLSEFNRISVREIDSIKLVQELIHKDVPVVLDPTLLLNQKQWIEALGLDDECNDSSYCLVYFLSEPSDEAKLAIEFLRDRYVLKTIPYQYECYRGLENVDAGPIEFVELIKNASYIITDSFHGTIFSINFDKEFVVFERQYGLNENQSTRLYSVLKLLNLENRYIKKLEQFKVLYGNSIDYRKVRVKLNSFRKESLIWLENSLKIAE